MSAHSFRRPICHLNGVLLLAASLANFGQANAQPPATFQDGVTTPPVPLRVVEPEYTPEARRAGFHGFCIVRLTVDERGLPQNVRVARPVGMGLDEAAIKAVKQERFKPAMRGGLAVAFPLSMQVNFKPAP
jgi:TonB family protein